MEKRFKVLRVIGTLWKVLAWVELILGVLTALGILLGGLLGGSLFEQLIQGSIPELGGTPIALGALSGVVGFLVVGVGAVFYFLILYAIGEMIYLLLAIEENTRAVSYQVATWTQQAPAVSARYSPPPSPYAPAEATMPIES